MSEPQRGRGGRGEGGPRGGAGSRGGRGGRGGGGGFQDRGGRGGGGGFQGRGGRGGGGGFQDRGERGGGGGFQDQGGRGGGGGFQDRGGRGGGGDFHRRGGRGRGAGDQGDRRAHPSPWGSCESKEEETTPQIPEASESDDVKVVEAGGDGNVGGFTPEVDPKPGPSTSEDPLGGPSSAHQKKRKGKKGGIETQMKCLSLRHEDRMLPSRPDIGEEGKTVEVGVNCWDFDIETVVVYMYDLEPTKAFRDKTHDLKAKSKMLRELLREVVNGFPQNTFYDGGRILYSLKKLDDVGEVSVKRLVPVADPLGRDELWLEYTIQEVKRISASNIFEYLNNPLAKTSDIPQDAINMVDNLLKWVNRSDFVNFGRSAMFFPEPKQKVPEKLFVIHSGFMFSVRPQWKVRMNIDMVHKAFFPTGNLADILYSKYGDDMYESSMSAAMLADIKGLRVEAGHYKTATGKSYKKRFTVFGLSPKSANEEKIPERDISIKSYFEEQYSITLIYPDLPCVKTKRDKNEYIPMELLTVLPYQNPTADKGDIASAVIRCAAVKPGDRFKELDKFVRQFMKNQHCLLSQFSLRLQKPEPVTVNARELSQPVGQFHSQPIPLGRGKWNPSQFYRPATGPVKWAVFATPPSRFAKNAIDTVQRDLPRTASQFGLNFSPTPYVTDQVPPALLEQKFSECKKNGVNLMVFVLSGNNEYPRIKRLGDLHTGMVTQCVKSQTLGKPNVFPNLLLKINGKLGGTNWLVKSLTTNNELIMVMGADVTHPAPTGGNRELSKSVAAVIASISSDLMQYAAVVRQQDKTRFNDKATREVIDSMDAIVRDLLEVFFRHNTQLPKKIIFYRDGVSEGQFETVLREELTAIQKACNALQPGYEPGVTFIVVQKRHHIRFLPKNPIARNVNPGTVVDTDITHKREFDFYLCSQEGIQGTSKPAHYHVLYDDNNWCSDALQSFTYYLCHAYMRCCRSVSYPAPTFYSHLAAFRARDWLKGSGPADRLLDSNRFMVNKDQQSRMFFL